MTESNERACGNCLHAAKRSDEWPCRGCGFEYGNGAFDKWEPARAAAPQAPPDWIAAAPAETVAAEYGVPQAKPWLITEMSPFKAMQTVEPPHAQPAPAERGKEDERAAVEFYTRNPSAALLDFGRRIDGTWLARSPEPAPISDDRIASIAEEHADIDRDARGITSYEFDTHGLIAFSRALLAEKGTPT